MKVVGGGIFVHPFFKIFKNTACSKFFGNEHVSARFWVSIYDIDIGSPMMSASAWYGRIFNDFIYGRQWLHTILLGIGHKLAFKNNLLSLETSITGNNFQVNSIGIGSFFHFKERIMCLL